MTDGLTTISDATLILELKSALRASEERARKAEALVELTEAVVTTWRGLIGNQRFNDRATAAEARVKELEAAIAGLSDCRQWEPECPHAARARSALGEKRPTPER